MSNDIFSYDDDNSIPSSIRERYNLISCLKHTPEKQVYLLADISTGEKVILKCATGKSLELLETEYNFLLNQNFSFLPTVISGEKIGKHFYLIRKYYEGDTLESYVEKHGFLSINEALTIIQTISMCVGQLHAQNPPILHRDIKPQNFLRTPDGDFKIIDMETVKYYDDSSDYDTVVIGTRKTAAPEQFGYHQSSIKTDIYGLGVLLVYLLTGDYSLKENNLESLPFSLRKIILKCTSFDPGKRYKNVASFCKDIQIFRRFRLRAVTIRLILICLIGIMTLCGSVLIYEKFTHHKAGKNSSVQFMNPNIEKAARFYLDKEENEPISADELTEIETLLITGDKIFPKWHNHQEYHGVKWYEFAAMEADSFSYPLDDLKYFTGLKYLALDLQNIDDISVLKDLPLKKVSLMRNHITDISPLASIASLEHIQLQNNPVTSLEGFENLSNLNTLLIMNTKVTDLSPIKNCPLTELNCAFTNVQEYDFLPSLPKLNTLAVSHIKQENIKDFNSLTSLKQLSMIDSEITSLNKLVNLENLTSLDVTGCMWLDNIKGVEEFKYLEYIAITSTKVSDISPLQNLPYLHCLESSYAPIEDFTPLLNCPVFDTFYINKELAEKAKEQLKDKMITYNIID